MREIKELFHEMNHTFLSLFDGAWFKWLVAAFFSIVTFISPNETEKKIFSAIALLVFVDFVTGIRASFINGGFVTSKLLGKTFNKFIVYCSLYAIVHSIPLLESYEVFNGLSVAIIGLAVGKEIISILENLGTLGNPWATKIARKLNVKIDEFFDEKETVSSNKLEEQTGHE